MEIFQVLMAVGVLLSLNPILLLISITVPTALGSDTLFFSIVCPTDFTVSHHQCYLNFSPPQKTVVGVCVSLKRLPKMACRSLAATCGRIRFTESARQTRGTTQRLWWRGPSALSSGGGLIMKTAFCFADIHLSLTEIICCKETLATAQVKQLSFHTVSLYRRWDPRTAF